MDAHEWKILGFLTAPIIGLYALIVKHMTAGSRHPKADDLVYSDVCEERGKANDQAHEHLKESIEVAIARSDEKHVELKQDMRTGFGEIKDLIRAKK